MNNYYSGNKIFEPTFYDFYDDGIFIDENPINKCKTPHLRNIPNYMKPPPPNNYYMQPNNYYMPPPPNNYYMQPNNYYMQPFVQSPQPECIQHPQPVTFYPNSQSPYETIPSGGNHSIELYKKNKNNFTGNNQDYHGHFAMPIRSGDPDRKTISDIFSATSWSSAPAEFDGINTYDDWRKESRKELERTNWIKDHFVNSGGNNSNSMYNSDFILKVILFIILIVLIVVLFTVIGKSAAKKRKNIQMFFADEKSEKIIY